MTREEHFRLVEETQAAIRERGYRGLHAVACGPNDDGRIGVWLFSGPDVDSADAVVSCEWDATAPTPRLSLIVAVLIGEMASKPKGRVIN